MAHANLFTSKRLQRVLLLISDGKEHSTLDIAINARVCAVNSAISELRVGNGIKINCRCVGSGEDRVFYYRIPAFAFIDR